MQNGCPKCEALSWNSFAANSLWKKVCLDCRIEQAEQNKDVAIKEWEKLKQEKEQENAKCKTIQQK